MSETEQDIPTDVDASKRFDQAAADDDIKTIAALTEGDNPSPHAQREFWPYEYCATSPLYPKK